MEGMYYRHNLNPAFAAERNYINMPLFMLGNFNVLSTIGLGSIIPYESIAIWVALAYLLAGSLIGALGSVFSTRAHLKHRAANM